MINYFHYASRKVFSFVQEFNVDTLLMTVTWY